MWNKQWEAQTLEKFISKVLTKQAEKSKTADWESGEKSEHNGKAGRHSNNILAQDGRRSRFKYSRRQLAAGETREGN